MTIKDLICKEKFGKVKESSEYNQHLLQTMTDQMMKYSILKPSQFYRDWIKGSTSHINKLDISLIKDYPIEYKCGYEKQQFFVTSLSGYDVRDYVKMVWNFDLDFKLHKLLIYDQQRYIELTTLIVALTVNKYKIETLYLEHIIFICVKVMITFFTLYKDDTFLIPLVHVYDMSKYILYTDISLYESIAEQLGFRCQEQPTQRKSRTLTKEEVMKFINPEDSQTAIKEKIMKWCQCGERKARQIMQQHGLTYQKYTRKDYLTLEHQTDDKNS